MKKLIDKIKNKFEKSNDSLLRLNLGCGNDYRLGYLNVDFNDSHKVDLISDVVNLREIQSDSCVEVVAQDVLEHIQRCRCLTALKEWNRVLKMDGTLKIRVPSIIDLANLLKDKNKQDIENQMNIVKCLFGTQGYEGDFHYNGFTEPVLKFYMGESGFQIKSIDIFDGWMFDVVAEKIKNTRPDVILMKNSDEDFVKSAYVELLSREGDEGGVGHYLKVLKSGISREAVIDSLKESDEYKKTNKN